MTQKRKDKKAAMRFFKKLLKELKGAPVKVVLDKLRSYTAAQRNLIPNVKHSAVQYDNNRCQLSHQPTPQHERQIRKFKSQGQA